MNRDRGILWTHQPPLMNQWRAFKWRLIHVTRPLSHAFISVYHEGRDRNLLLATNEKVCGSEERVRAKINAEFFCIHLDSCKYDLTRVWDMMCCCKSACVSADCYTLKTMIKWWHLWAVTRRDCGAVQKRGSLSAPSFLIHSQYIPFLNGN